MYVDIFALYAQKGDIYIFAYFLVAYFSGQGHIGYAIQSANQDLKLWGHLLNLPGHN